MLATVLDGPLAGAVVDVKDPPAPALVAARKDGRGRVTYSLRQVARDGWVSAEGRSWRVRPGDLVYSLTEPRWFPERPEVDGASPV